MADVTLNFDAALVDPRQSTAGICFPLADYPVEITAVEAVAVQNSKDKGMLVINLKVLDGQYKGQIQADRLNLYGQAETPTRIAYQHLSAICHATGRLRIGQASELVGGRFIATIGPQDAPNDGYSEVKLVKDLAGNIPVAGQPVAPQNTPIQAPAPAAQAALAATAPATAAATPWNNPAQPPAPATAAPAASAQPWATGGGAALAASSAPPWAR